MAEAPRRRPRIIPTWELGKPPSAGLSNEEAEGLAQSAVISGAAGQSGVPTDSEVTTTLGLFASSLYITGLGGNYI